MRINQAPSGAGVTVSPTPMTIPAQRDVWAVGSSFGGGITDHFDGSRWTKFFSKGLYLGVTAAASASDIWATATNEQFGSGLRLVHLNAGRTAWTTVGARLGGISDVGAIAVRADGPGWVAGDTASAGQPQLAALCGL